MLFVKIIRDMTAKLQDGYKKKNAMHVSPKHKLCKKKKKKRLVKYLKTKNFSVSIG